MYELIAMWLFEFATDVISFNQSVLSAVHVRLGVQFCDNTLHVMDAIDVDHEKAPLLNRVVVEQGQGRRPPGRISIEPMVFLHSLGWSLSGRWFKK